MTNDNVNHQSVNNQNANMTRSYSQVSKPITINEIKETIESTIMPRFKEFETKLTQIETKIAEQTTSMIAVFKANIESALKYNNIRVCYFLIDALKSSVQNFQLKKEQAVALANAFKRHELGNVDHNELMNLASGQKHQPKSRIS